MKLKISQLKNQVLLSQVSPQNLASRIGSVVKWRLSYLEQQIFNIWPRQLMKVIWEDAAPVKLCMMDGTKQAKVCMFCRTHLRQIIHGVSKS